MNTIAHPTILINILNKLDYWDLESAYYVCTWWQAVINEYKLWYIWENNLRELVGLARLSSILEVGDYFTFYIDLNSILEREQTKEVINAVIKLRDIIYCPKRRLRKCVFEMNVYNYCILNHYVKFMFLYFYDNIQKLYGIKNREERFRLTQKKNNLFTLDKYNHRHSKVMYVIHYMIEDISKKYIRKLFHELHPHKVVIIPIISYLVFLHKLNLGIVIYTILNKMTIVAIIIDNRIVRINKIPHSCATLSKGKVKIDFIQKSIIYGRIPEIIRQLLSGFSDTLIDTLFRAVFLIGFQLGDIVTNLKQALLKCFPKHLTEFNFEIIYMKIKNDYSEEVKSLLEEIGDQHCSTELTSTKPFSCTIIDYIKGKLDEDDHKINKEPSPCSSKSLD